MFIVHWFTVLWHAGACTKEWFFWYCRKILYRPTSIVSVNGILNDFGRLILYTWNRRIHLMQVIIQYIFLVDLYFCRSLYLDKWDLSISELQPLMCITLITITRYISLVDFIPWNIIPRQRQFHCLFLVFSMRSSYHM